MDSPLLELLTRHTADLTASYAVAATGVYLPPANGQPAVALRISTPTGCASDAYYQELLAPEELGGLWRDANQ
jgi:hypothetical protein